MTKLLKTKPYLLKAEDHVITTSLAIATHFGKRHDNVLRSIQRLDCSEEFSALNFEGAKYTDEQGEQRPMYHITRDGFVFLVMGFRGKKAALWKERYINAFNQMEAALLNQHRDALAYRARMLERRRQDLECDYQHSRAVMAEERRAKNQKIGRLKTSLVFANKKIARLEQQIEDQKVQLGLWQDRAELYQIKLKWQRH